MLEFNHFCFLAEPSFEGGLRFTISLCGFGLVLSMRFKISSPPRGSTSGLTSFTGFLESLMTKSGTPFKLSPNVYYLRTGMTEQKLQIIGAITIMWNQLELQMKKLTWTCGELDEKPGALITMDLFNVSLIVLARNLLQSSTYHHRTKDEGTVVFGIFDHMRNRRNALIHGTPEWGPHGWLPGKLARFTAKEAKGSVTIKSIDVTEQYLQSLISDLVLATECLADCQRKLDNEIRFRSDPSIRTRFSFESFVFGYRAPEIDIVFLETALAKLNPQPPSPSKSQKKPKPSRASPRS